MKIRADHEACIGAGLCVMAAPEVFDQDAVDGRVVITSDEPAADLHAAVIDAVGLCPVAALTLMSQ